MKTGTCISNTAAKCNSVPAISHGTSGNCFVGAADGAVCTPICDLKYTGTLSATCDADTDSWAVLGVCTREKPFKVFNEDPLFADKVQATVNADTSTSFVTDDITTEFSDTDADDELDQLEISQHIFDGDVLDIAARGRHCLAVWTAVNTGACLEHFAESDCGIELADCTLVTPTLKRQDSNYTIVTLLEYAAEAGASAVTLSFFAVAASVFMALIL